MESFKKQNRLYFAGTHRPGFNKGRYFEALFYYSHQIYIYIYIFASSSFLFYSGISDLMEKIIQ